MTRINHFWAIIFSLTSLSYSNLDAASQPGTFSSLRCGSSGYWDVDGFSVSVNIKATTRFADTARKTIIDLQNFTGSYTITYLDDPETKINPRDDKMTIWSKGFQAAESIANDTGYRPRKYRGHTRFYLDWTTHGETQLIMPFKPIQFHHRFFKAYLIMSQVEDHFGATIPLLCEQSKI